MIRSYEDSVSHLVSQGWIEKSPGAYAKNGYEIVFDTSHYVELYKNNSTRLAESRIESVQNLIEFLKANHL